MKKIYLLFPFLALSLMSRAQMTIQSGATLFIESGAKVTVQGDLTSSANIQGPGTILMKGSGLQNITMNGAVIPNLEIDNLANVTLNGSGARIGSSLLFTNGKLLTSSQDLILSPTATITGQNASRFIWTDGTGQVKKELTADITDFEIPIGFNTTYRPVYLTSTGGSYAGANIGVRTLGAATTSRPPMMANFLQTSWPVTKTGITGGTQTISGQYVDPTDVTGTESTLVGYFFNGTDWTSVNESHDAAANRVGMPITTASGELTGMNKFIAVGARAFLQAAYVTSDVPGLMGDFLRRSGNVIPAIDPYPALGFSHIANTQQNASGTVFNNQASINDDIVDWVFLELRNNAASPGNTVLQTRSALIQRDGDIVDIDGISPVTFNNVIGNNFTIAVRHRNHLGLASLPASPRTFTETKSQAFTTNVADLRNVATSLFGTSGVNYTTASHGGLGTVNLLWSGNANANAATRYNGPANDRDYILSSILSGSQSSVVNGYSIGDLNLNKVVRYNGPSNDRDFLLSTPLSGNQSTVRSQALPN